MKKSVMLIVVSLMCSALIMSCGPSMYVHKNPAFSYEFPAGYKPTKLEGKKEVSRFGNPANKYNLPVYVASVYDKPKGLKLEAAPDELINGIKKTYPKALRFKMIEKKRVKLSDGSNAMTMTFKWKHDPSAPVYLQTSAVMSFKEDKMITITGSTLFGYTPLDVMMKHCLTLNLSPQ